MKSHNKTHQLSLHIFNIWNKPPNKMQLGPHPPFRRKTLPLRAEYLKLFGLIKFELNPPLSSSMIGKNSFLSLVAHHQYKKIN